MEDNFDLKKTIKRIEEKISKIAINTHVQKKPEEKETWVKVSTVRKLTGWNKDQLHYARKTNKIKMKRNEEGIFYLLESLHPVHYK